MSLDAIVVCVSSTYMFALEKSKPRGGGRVVIYFSVQGRAAEQGIIFRVPTPGQGIIFCKNRLHDRVHICHFHSETRPFTLANVIQIAWKAIFPHLSIDFIQISLQDTILSEETKGQGIV